MPTKTGGALAPVPAADSPELISAPCSVKVAPADPFFSGRRHFPELDGLRGIAILLVLATHYQMAIPAHTAFERAVKNILAHGWAGVDLFFVLSGFLITGILYDSKGQSNYFRNFYGRRTLRIFPLYYGFLAVVLVGLTVAAMARHWDPSLPQFRNLWSMQPWLWTYTFNVACAFGHGSAHLGQLWSLSVEEQFYLVWPLVICFFARRLLVPTCITMIIAALALRICLFYYAPQVDAYFLTPARMDSLAFGALVAILIRSRHAMSVPKIANWALLVAGVLLAGRFSLGLTRWITHRGTTAGAVSRLSELWDSTLIFTVVAVFFTALLVKAISPGLGRAGHTVAAACRGRPLRTAGKYSYGWYVFHYPIWTWSFGLATGLPLLRGFRENAAFAPALIAGNLVVSFALAVTSYHLYEKHFLKLKKYFPERGAAEPQVTGDGLQVAGAIGLRADGAGDR